MIEQNEPTGNISDPALENEQLKKWLFLILGHWYLFVLFAIIGGSGAYLLIRYTTPIYKVKSSVLIKQVNGNDMGKGAAMMTGFSSVDNNLVNETILLKTPTQIKNTLDQLDFNICYFSEGRFGRIEFYPEMPFLITIDSTHVQPLNIQFHLVLNANGKLHFQAEGKNVVLYNFKQKRVTGSVSNLTIDQEIEAGQSYISTYYSFGITQTDTPLEKLVKTSDYFFVLKSNENLVNEFSNIDLQKAAEGSSVVYLYHTGPCLNKSIAFINQLMQYWFQSGLDKKNQMANNTIDFINKQLGELGDTLNSVSNKLQNFRTSNQVVLPEVLVQTNFMKLEALDAEKLQLQLQKRYIEQLKTYLSNREDYNKLVAPSVVGINVVDFGTYLRQLSEIRGELFQFMGQGKLNNPYLLSLQKKEEILMASIQEYIKNLSENISFNLKTIETQKQRYTYNQNKLPAKEQELFDIQRSFKLTDNLYTMLLTIGIEAQIKKLSNVADNEIVELAKFDSQIEPQTKKIRIAGLLAGLAIPFLYLLALDFLNNKIETRDDLERLTRIPVIGSITESNEGVNFVTMEKPRSSTSEAFRVLRTRITYLTRGESQQTIMITSSVVGEGKTFCAVNLAGIMALSGKKTIILGLDLRKPRLKNYFKTESDLGISNYLINECSLEEVIQPTGFEHLDCILSGPIPPNPAELITTEKMAELFKKLKETYDYIIIDTSPVGLVTDPLLLSPYCNAMLYVVKHKFTVKELFAYNIGLIEESGIGNIGILMNGIKTRGRGYGYGYGYGYGEKETKKSKKKSQKTKA